MCGIIASILADPTESVSPLLYEGLSILQHRGQDATGIVTNGPKGRLFQCKGNGMVRDVFDEVQISKLKGSIGVGHVRYPTAGSSSITEAQPFYVNSPYGIVMAHNGNLTNTHELRHYLDYEVHRHINTESDSECLLNILAEYLTRAGKVRINEEDVFKAIKGLMQKCRGAYACTAMIPGFGIIGFRDPNGIRPIVIGRKETSLGYDYMMASESVVLDFFGYGDITDIKPGQAVIVTKSNISFDQCAECTLYAPCIFEYVYFARPDSMMNGISVYKSRLAMGEALARQVKKEFGRDLDIDVVIPVPDTSRVAALQCSYILGILYREGFIKNRYVGRTFIMPGQKQRQKSVRRKLNPMPMEFAQKNVLIVDDSVVRGTTSKEIVQMARESGAKKVYFASCAPPIRYPNVYGIDMPTRTELVAHNRTIEEIADTINADKLIFQDLNDLVESCKKFNPEITTFDVSVFDGKYITNDISGEYLNDLQISRSRKNSGDSNLVSAGSIQSPDSYYVNGSSITSPSDISVQVKNRMADRETLGLHNNFKK